MQCWILFSNDTSKILKIEFVQIPFYSIPRSDTESFWWTASTLWQGFQVDYLFPSISKYKGFHEGLLVYYLLSFPHMKKAIYSWWFCRIETPLSQGKMEARSAFSFAPWIKCSPWLPNMKPFFPDIGWWLCMWKSFSGTVKLDAT